MIKKKIFKQQSYPEYQSTVINKNNDGTYEVKHTFVDKDKREILVTYPKIQITIDTNVDFFNQFYCVFPCGSYEVLPIDETKELFTLTIKK